MIDIILRNSKRLMQLTEDILDVTKIESGSFALRKEKFDFDKMIMEILDEYHQRITEGNGDNVSLYYEGNEEGGPIIIEGDRSRHFAKLSITCLVLPSNSQLREVLRLPSQGIIAITRLF